jgi:hypothetical protein
VGRTIAMVVIRIVETVFGAKEKATAHKNSRKYGQNNLDIHKYFSGIPSLQYGKDEVLKQFP